VKEIVVIDSSDRWHEYEDVEARVTVSGALEIWYPDRMIGAFGPGMWKRWWTRGARS